MPRADLLTAVEMSYELGADQDVWMKQVVDALRPSMDTGLGILGWRYDARDFANLKFANPVFLDVPAGLPEALFSMARDPAIDVRLTEKHYCTPAGPFSASLGSAFHRFEPFRRFLHPIGVRDLIVINAIDPDRQGCAVSAPRSRMCTRSPERIALFARVAAHLATAQRLRRRIRGTPNAAPIEAVLTPSGRIDHAQGGARERPSQLALQDAVRAAERARGKLRRMDPHKAMDSWKAMVDGRWSLVDQFEANGRRYLVAYVNPPQAPGPRALSRVERAAITWAAFGHSNKLIAYELGVSPSTVAVFLRRARQKLGASNTIGLLRLYAALRNQAVEADASPPSLSSPALPAPGRSAPGAS